MSFDGSGRGFRAVYGRGWRRRGVAQELSGKRTGTGRNSGKTHSRPCGQGTDEASVDMAPIFQVAIRRRTCLGAPILLFL